MFALSSLSAVVVSDNHVKSYIKKKYQDYAAKKIVISEGKVVTEDNELMKIIRPLCLGNDIDITVINMQDDVLEKHARKKVDDENQKYYLLAQVDRRKKKIALCHDGIRKISELYRKGFIRCEVDRLPIIVKRYVSIIYPTMPNESSFTDKQQEKAFDIYSNNVAKGEVSFIADIPEAEVDIILKKLEIKSTQEMCSPYMYSILDIPEQLLYEYVLPAQVFYGLTRHKEIASEAFWAPQNWAIGPH